ncbi:hypothetical protein BJAS_P3638 [Bathymodiolus japonicus methanotrophic gill symbiont]|nr:hypothetical protein BJAS_P3638 [Bathymodiolus japonicus methanotrophic gill symbiont]
MCIQLLVEWFHNPDKYQWVCIEGTKTEGNFKGLDDIIALNKEGYYELFQVKFTIDSKREDLKLSFDWLLDKTKRGTSFLQKWESDTAKYNAENLLSIAALKTNRIPDNEVAKSLHNNKINIDLIPERYLEKIKEQLEGYQKAKKFFDIFTFDHSQPEIEDLENKLKDELIPDHCPTEEGWLRFLKAVERWATRKNEPAPVGKIKIDHIRELLTAGVSRSISQFFEIPEGYTPPSEEFHLDILEKIKSTGCWVISGLPGMGKSTYLSYLTEKIIEQDIPVIRHHYSLSAQSVIDRVSYPNAARSLQNQLQLLFSSLFISRDYDLENLDEWIRMASDEANQQSKKLIVIIDGLDHVGRERPNISQLGHLINRLIPLRDKICLILGTQPVSDTHLPSSLTSNVPRDQYWLNLPLMDLSAIKCWIEGLSNSKKVTLIGTEDYKARELVEISEAFLKVSGGYPLHLIYSIKSLTSYKKHLNKYDIERLPTCPDGDIHNYYATLWSNLSASAREILLLIACVEFPWPNENSIGSCFQDSLLFKEAFHEIQHLVEKRRSGIIPFHGSILVFLKNKQEYQDSLNELLLKVQKWLAESAPEYWRWGWEWIVEANLEEVKPLINGINREWLVESFCKGYPLQHIEHIISMAEKVALEYNMFPELVGLRLIKIRLINGPEYQLQEYDEFLKCALKWNPESYGLLWRADNLRLLDDKEIPVVSLLFKDRDNLVAEDCLEEVLRRLKFYARIRDSSQSDKIDTLTNAVIDILVNISSLDIRRILAFLNQLRDKETFFKKTLNQLVVAGNGHLILEIPSSVVPDGFKYLYWDYFVLACCNEGIELTNRPEKNQIGSSALGVIALLLEKQSIDTKLLEKPSLPDKHENATDDYFYNLFFISLAKQLEKKVNIENPVNVSVDSVELFISKASSAFKYAAHYIATKVEKEDGIDIFEIYKLIKQAKLPARKECDFDSTRIWHFISKTLTRISLDMYLLLSNTRSLKKLNSESFETLKDNSWWHSQSWLEQANYKSIHIIPKEVSEQEIRTSLSSLVAKQDNTSRLANDSLDLAKLSCLLSLNKETQQCLKWAAQHTLGYGWRKDTTFSELYEAMEACSEYGVGNIPDWLRRVAPFTNDIFDYTEKEIRHIPGWYIDLLAKHSPERLVDEFDYHLSNQNWSIAHDILEKFVEHFPLNTPAEHAFLRCLTSYEALSKLRDRAEKNPSLSPLYKSQCDFLGGFPPAPKEHSSNSFEEKNIDIKPETYPPEQLDDLDEELNDRGLYLADEFLESWISYWVEQDRGLDVIKAFEKVWNDEHSDSIRLGRSLHVIFSISQKLQGTKKAYQWAIRDIRTNNHWGRWSGSRAEECLNKYAKIYKSDWKTLLIDTTKGELITLRRNEWVVVPTSQLVSYLLSAEQPDLACRITEVMLESLENEIAHLPISSLHWYEQPVLSDQVASRLLLLYSKWPDRLARLRTANEFSLLLNSSPDFRKLYLEHLGKQNYEIEITDLLSILLLTEGQIFSDEELLDFIKYPSILSDEILRRLGYKDDDQREIACYHSKLTSDSYVESDRFEKSKDGMAPVYFGIINELGDRLGYPLYQHMSSEWDIISTRQDFFYFNPYDFCGDQFYRQDRISCSFSTQIESVVLSAYLRTLSFAYTNLKASYDEVSALGLQVAPFGGLCSSLLPSSKPDNWPIISKLSKEDELPTNSDLSNYLDGLINCEPIILRANGPVLHDLSGVCYDLEVSFVFDVDTPVAQSVLS